jgi:hypothetical protein
MGPGTLRVYCSLFVRHDDLDPTQATDQFGLQPTKVYVKGQPCFPGGKMLAKSSAWILSTQSVVRSRSLNRHLAYITKLLKPKAEALSLYREKGYAVSVGCYVLACENAIVRISLPNLRRLAALKLETWFDLYLDGTADQEGEAGEES